MIYVVGIALFFSIVAVSKVVKMEDEIADLNADLYDLKDIIRRRVIINRKNCEYRHENGNCLKVGGFCTSVDDEHCVKGGRE